METFFFGDGYGNQQSDDGYGFHGLHGHDDGYNIGNDDFDPQWAARSSEGFCEMYGALSREALNAPAIERDQGNSPKLKLTTQLKPWPFKHFWHFGNKGI